MASRKNYVNNSDLRAEILLYRESGKISHNLGKMLLLIAKGVSGMSWFRRYGHHIDDLRQEGVVAAIKALKKFNPEKSQNAFAYLTQCMFHQFQAYLKKKYQHDNFRMEMMEEEFRKNNRQFVNEIQRTMDDEVKRKEKGPAGDSPSE